MQLFLLLLIYKFLFKPFNNYLVIEVNNLNFIKNENSKINSRTFVV